MKFFDFGAGIKAGMIGKTILNKLFNNVTNAVKGVFQVIVDATKQAFNEMVEKGTFDMSEQIDKDTKEFKSAAKLQSWLKPYIRKHAYKGILVQGHMYMFDYDDPLTKDKLAFYDTSPLVLSFGIYMAHTGNLVEYAVNLHFLPYAVRRDFLKDVFELFRKQYRGKMYSSKPRAINEFSWETLQQFVAKYKIDFAVRSYVFEKRKNCIMFDYQDWGKAMMIPSKGYVGTDDKVLQRLYKLHQTKPNKSTK